MNIFRPDHAKYEGVRPINIYMMRTLFLLMFVFVSLDSWSAILRHEGEWQPMRSAALTMFASYAFLSILGVIRPLKMLPIMVFMVLYKSIWVMLVAYPLWSNGTLVGSPVEGMARIFVWVPVAIVAVPWGYFVRHYVLGPRRAA